MFTLLYHQINDIPSSLDSLRLSVSPTQFEIEMADLKKRGFICLPLSDIVKARKNAQSLPKRSFAITFDDGYQDNYDIAFPILKKYGFTATIFLVTSLMGKTTQWEGLNTEQAFPLMKWEFAKKMCDEGFEFGSHTHTHANLVKIDKAKISGELELSKRIISDELGKAVEMFAFPYESTRADLGREIEKQGYLAACGSLSLPEDRYNLWRTQCYGTDTMPLFRLKTSGIWRKLNLLRFHTQTSKVARSIIRRFRFK